MMITHDLGVVAGIAARVQVMYGGTIVESGPVEDIFAEPRMPYTIGLLGSVPNPELLGKPLTPDPRRAAVAAAPAAGLLVRPALPAGRAGVPGRPSRSWCRRPAPRHTARCRRWTAVTELEQPQRMFLRPEMHHPDAEVDPLPVPRRRTRPRDPS